VSSPGPEHAEVAGLLLRKAGDDLQAGRALAEDRDQADHVIGFHAQQAVEKAVKAVLAYQAVEIPRTHDLAYLTSLLGEDSVSALREARWLTPWGVTWRYDDPAEALDRARAVETASAVVAWAQDAIGA
jgi:HEPN domain-containing protein